MRVLHVMSAMDGGGVESTVMNLYRNIDRTQIHFDFMVFGDRVGALEYEAEAMGSSIYHVPPKREGVFRYIKSIKHILRQNPYDIVHCHQAEKGMLIYYIAKKMGSSKCVMHSHGCWNHVGKIVEYRKRLELGISRRFVDAFCSCSETSAAYSYQNVPSIFENCHVILNCFEINNFCYSSESRQAIRKQYEISDSDVVIGMVGRLSPEKNHMLMMTAALQIMKKNQNVKFMIVGGGELDQTLRDFANKTDFAENFIFCGNQIKPAPFYSAMDIFCMPSRHEGFGMALVEAQIAGLNCLISENITREAVVIPDCVEMVEIENEECVCMALSALIERKCDRTVDLTAFDKFTTDHTAAQLIQLYGDILS